MDTSGLLALRAPDGATVTLERYPILLGRAVPGGSIPDVDVSHLDPAEVVDNRHCQLTRDPEGVEVHDLGGAAGTWVDGRRLPPGGRAVLEVGGTLRVAGVSMELVEAGIRPLPPPPRLRSEAPPPPPDWPEPRPLQMVPPPPSAGPGERPEAPAPARREWEPPPDLDLSGAPVLGRGALAGGAEAVRIRAGAPLSLRRSHSWRSEGEVVGDAALAEAVASSRRALGLPADAASGRGRVGDVALSFVCPPLAAATAVSVALAPRVPAELEVAALDDICWVLRSGGALLVAALDPEPALATLARALDPVAEAPRALSFPGDPWWPPQDWPRLEPGNPAVMGEALQASELFVDEPPPPELEVLLQGLPRAAGGTVLSLRSRSVAGALQRLARAQSDRLGLEPVGLRAETAWLLPRALSWDGTAWVFSQTADAGG